MSKNIFSILALLLLSSCSTGENTQVESFEPFSAGSSFETTIESEGIGQILVEVQIPETARYESGAPVLVYVPTFFTPDIEGFSFLEGADQLGIVQVTLMYPGRSDGKGNVSDGSDDFGGELSIQALKDTILFAHGELTNTDGKSIAELSELAIDTENVGLYAFSHPGIAAVNVLATYPNELSFVDYFVGRENPTVDAISAMDLGYEESGVLMSNSMYQYPSSYDKTSITIDYSSAQYDFYSNRPYLDLNGNGELDSDDYLYGKKTPTMFGKYFYSRELLQALADNKVFAETGWPMDLATAEEAQEIWPSREDLSSFAKLSKKLKVMLVFSELDHVQVVKDKPHIHQAYDQLSEAGLWVRLNPDSNYVTALAPEQLVDQVTEHEANSEPSDWLEIGSWAYSAKLQVFVPLAAVAEMADRTMANDWSDELSETLIQTTSLQKND